MTDHDINDTQLDLMLSLGRLITEAERAKTLRDRLVSQVRDKSKHAGEKAKSLTGKDKPRD